MSRIRNTKRIVAGFAAAALCATGVGLMVTGGNSGAYYTDSQTGHVAGNTGNLTMQLGDGTNVGTFRLQYNNVVPGSSVVKNFTVQNTGSVAATVSLGGVSNATFTDPAPALTGSEINQLTVGVDGYQAQTGVASLPSSMNLGSLNPGETRTYSLRINLDPAAGNDWQNTAFSADATVTLEQAH